MKITVILEPIMYRSLYSGAKTLGIVLLRDAKDQFPIGQFMPDELFCEGPLNSIQDRLRRGISVACLMNLEEVVDE